MSDIAQGVANAFVPTLQTAIQTSANKEAAILVDTISTQIAFTQAALNLDMRGGFSLFPPGNNPHLVLYGLGAFR